MQRSHLCPSITLALLTLAAPGCGGDSKKDADPAVGKASSAAACDVEYGNALEQELMSQCLIGEQRIAADVPHVPWRPKLAVVPPAGLRIELGPDGAVVGFGPPVPVAELTLRLAQAHEQSMMERAQGRTGHSGWVLTIASATPRADVAAALQAFIAAGQPQGHLRLATAVPLLSPRDPKLLAELGERLSAADPSQKAMLIAKEIEQNMPPCPAVREAFSTVATVAPDERCTMLATAVSEGLVGCSCPKEDTLMTLLYALSVGTEKPKQIGATLRVTLDPTATPRPGATWADVVAGLDENALTSLWVSAT